VTEGMLLISTVKVAHVMTQLCSCDGASLVNLDLAWQGRSVLSSYSRREWEHGHFQDCHTNHFADKNVVCMMKCNTGISSFFLEGGACNHKAENREKMSPFIGSNTERATGNQSATEYLKRVPVKCSQRSQRSQRSQCFPPKNHQ
jgi:hypothetical protein